MTLYYKDFDNKTVVITGGASGLGKGAAKVFAKYDANIVLVDIDREKLDLVRNEISQNGLKVSYYIILVHPNAFVLIEPYISFLQKIFLIDSFFFW